MFKWLKRTYTPAELVHIRKLDMDSVESGQDTMSGVCRMYERMNDPKVALIELRKELGRGVYSEKHS